MDQAIEALNLVSAILNLIAGPVSIAANFAQSLIQSAATDWGAGDAGGVGLKTAANLTKAEAQKIEVLVGPAEMRISRGRMGWDEYAFTHFKSTSEWQTGTRTTLSTAQLQHTALGLMFDLSSLFLKGYYGKFCERLEGPLTAKMVGQIEHNGTPYWKFTVGLKGKLVLRHAKTEPGMAVRVRGQFIGFGTDFAIFEDIVNVLFADTVKQNRAITFHKVTTPVVNIIQDELNALLAPQGAAAQTLASPTGFYVPVEGDLLKDTLTLRIQPARFDFKEDLVAARAMYFLIGPAGAEFINQPFPYKNAHFVITHALNAEDSAKAELRVTVDSAKKTTTISGEFKRDFENKDAGATATYTMSVKACNPVCLP
jgi:hypothetical protein